MNAIEEFRCKLSLFQCELLTLLGSIADAEQRLNDLKRNIVELYEENDNLLDIDNLTFESRLIRRGP